MRTLALLLCCSLAACSRDAGDSAPGDDEPLTCAPDEPAAPPVMPMLQPFQFQVIGDPHGHVTGNWSNDNIIAALADLRAIGPGAAALVVNGDLTEHGYLDEWAGLNSSFAGGSAPPLWNIGNHDFHGTNSSAVERQRFLDHAGRSTVWLEHTINGYPFLLLGGENGDQESWGPGSSYAWYAVLSDQQLDWLDERLAAVASPTRPSFVFLHQGTWDTTNPARLEQILSSHPNVIFFWSHYHRDLHSAPIDGSLFSTSRGFLQVHTGSIQYSWDNASPNNRHDDWYGGLQVEVFSDRIQIRGRDHAARAWIPQFEFQLDQRPPSQLGAVGVNADGRLEVLTTAADGRGLRAVQDEPGGAWSSFVDDGRVGARAPVIAKNADGRLEAFVVGGDGAMWHAVQDAPDGAWSAWASLGGGFTSNVAIGTNLDGTLEIFARGTDHALWHSWQTAPGADTWAPWTSLGGIITSDVAVIENADGRLEVLTRAVDNSLVHIWQETPMGAWSGWGGLGGILISKVAVARHADGRVIAFALGIDGDLFHIDQVPGVGWSEWQSLGGSFASHPVVATHADGTLEVFVRGHDGAVYHRTLDGEWASLGGTFDSDVIVGVDRDGRLELFARGTDGGLELNRQQTPGDCWTGWTSLDVAVAAF